MALCCFSYCRIRGIQDTFVLSGKIYLEAVLLEGDETAKKGGDLKNHLLSFLHHYKKRG